MRKLFVMSAVLLFVFFAPSLVLAGPVLIINYQAIPISSSLWQYDYAVSYAPGSQLLGQYEAFDIFFDFTMYANLQNAVAGANWDPLVLQPDTGIPADGVFDVMANVSQPPLPDVFSIQFDWLGGGVPGSQPFSLVQYDAAGNLVSGPYSPGQTTPSSLPEPGTLPLLSLGLAGFLVSGRVLKQH